MTAAEIGYSEVIRYITEQESFKDDTTADYGEDTLENPHYIKRVSASHAAVIAGLTVARTCLIISLIAVRLSPVKKTRSC